MFNAACTPAPVLPACCYLLLQVQRYVVKSRLQAATQGAFSDLSLRRFVVRCVCVCWQACMAIQLTA